MLRRTFVTLAAVAGVSLAGPHSAFMQTASPETGDAVTSGTPVPGATPQTGTYDLTVTRVFDAPVERVWEAWSDSEQVKQWWGPTIFTVPVAEIDFREGGSSLICMRPPEGPDLCNTWTYSEIEPTERIEFVLRFADEEGNEITPAEAGLPPEIPTEVRHVITFEAVGGDRTEMTITEYGYPSPEIVALSKAGLDETLDKLAALVGEG